MSSRLIRMANSILAVVFLLFGQVSCTVKEDRRVCPCSLEVSFYDRERIEGPITMVGWSAEELFDVTIKPNDYPESYFHNAPRTMISFGAAAGVTDCLQSGHYLMIKEGNECDSLYVYSDFIDCTGETAHTMVNFHKQFVTLNLCVASAKYDANEYSLVIESNSCGIDMLSCKAIAGDFRCVPVFSEGNEYKCRIGRQGDESMTLTVTHSSGDIAVFPLGSFIGAIGYDWKAEDLQDIYISIDIARGKIGVGVAGWEGVEDFDLMTVEI